MRRRLQVRVLDLLALSVGIVVAIIATDFARFVLGLEDREPSIATPADGIVALTGGAERIADAITLARDGTRAAPPHHRRQPDDQRPRLVGDGAVDARSARPAASRSTATPSTRSAMRSRRPAGSAENRFHSIIVVTSSYHMPRSLMELRRVLPDTELIAYPVVSHGLKLDRWWQDAPTLRLLLVEYAKYTGAMLRLRFDRPTADTVRSAAL